MLTKLTKKIRSLPQNEQRVIFWLGVLASIFGFIAALNEWGDALRPGFIGATFGALLKDYINFLMGRDKDGSATTNDEPVGLSDEP